MLIFDICLQESHTHEAGRIVDSDSFAIERKKKKRKKVIIVSIVRVFIHCRIIVFKLIIGK